MCLLLIPKQLFTAFHKDVLLKTLRKTYMKTLELESLFDKVTGLQLQLSEKREPVQGFFCKFCKIFYAIIFLNKTSNATEMLKLLLHTLVTFTEEVRNRKPFLCALTCLK